MLFVQADGGLGAVLLFAWLAVLAAFGPPPAFDLAWRAAVHSYTQPWLTRLMWFASWIGGGWVLWPGGVLLVTVPCAARLEPDNADGDRWRFSAQGLTSLLETAFAGGDLRVHGEGNGDALVASLTGLAAEEVGTDRLERDDPAMPLLATARVVTPRGEAEA